MFESVVRAHVLVSGRPIPTWRVTAGLGLVAGVATASAGAAKTGLPVLDLLGLLPLVAGCDLAATWARRRLVGGETWVLYEHLALVLIIAAPLAWAGGLPVVPTLDVLWVGLATLFAFGRLGCLLAGCCHGVPCDVGVRYPAECVPDGHESPRAPVQLVESAGWALLAAAGLLGLGTAPPGAVLTAGLAAYAALRWTLEAWRGDARTHIAGVSYGRWWSGVALAASCGIAFATGRPPGLLAASGFVAIVLLHATSGRWLRPSTALDASMRERLVEIGREWAAACPSEPDLRVLPPYHVGASTRAGPDGSWWTVSVQATPAVSRAEARPIIDAVLVGLGAEGIEGPLAVGRSGLVLAMVRSLPRRSERAVPAPGAHLLPDQYFSAPSAAGSAAPSDEHPPIPSVKSRGGAL